MLASPLLVGALAAGPTWLHLPLALFWFVGYLAFFAVSLWLKSGRRTSYAPPALAYPLLALPLGLVLAIARPDLLRWAPAFLVPLGIGLWASAHRTERSVLSGLATTAGSSLMTLVAYDVSGGSDWRRAWTLAAVQAAYFGGTVFYVKSMIRARGDLTFRAVSIGYHAAVTVIAAAALLAGGGHWPGLSWAVVAVFVALTARAALVPRLALTPPQIGIGEIASTTAVAVTSLLAG
jgi:hypothetical protein